MALFPTHRHPGGGQHGVGGGGNLVPPDLMRRQTCHRPERHPYPVPMTFAGISIGRYGQPVAEHACPACGRRKGVAIHFRTGQVFTLFQKD